jgi:hypothetical protein
MTTESSEVSVSEEISKQPDNEQAQEGGGGLEAAVIRLRVITPDGEEISLEGISNAECVLAIRSALAEHHKTAHFSSYALMLETNGLREGQVEGGSEVNQGMEPVIVVGPDGFVQLNDVFELAEYAVVGLGDSSVIHMRRSPYDLRACRIHLKRLNELLMQPPPLPVTSPEAATDKYSEALSIAKAASDATSAIAAISNEQKEGAEISNKLQALHAEARKHLMRAEAHRREVDRVIAQRIPALSPAATLDGCSLGNSTSNNMAEFFPMVLGPAMLDCENRYLSPEVAALPGLAAYDKTQAEGNQTFLKNGEPQMESKKKRRNKQKNQSVSSTTASVSEVSSSSSSDLASDTANHLSGCVRYLCASAWNPPPPERKLAGDIIYIEVGLMENLEDRESDGCDDYDKSVIHITGTPNGWFINSSRSPFPLSTNSSTKQPVFDPSPRCINGKFMASPELFSLLSSVSKVFTANWTKAMKAVGEKAMQHDCPLAMIGMMVGEGRIDQVVIKHSWCVPDSNKSETTKGHRADWHRCQEDLNNSSIASDERGALRDWNEEFQCFQELPSATMLEKINRSKMIYKVWLEFQEAAVSGALAISLGVIPPINPTEPERQHVYVFNNTFFSYGVDSKEAYKVIGGDEAACKSARHDFRNTQLLDHFQNSVDQPPATPQAQDALEKANEQVTQHKRLCTLATALVDLPCGGRRLVAQSIIPGILSGDQLSKLVLGAILHDVPLVQDEGMKAQLAEAAKFYHIATREMPAIPLHALPTEDGVAQTPVDKKTDDDEKALIELHGAVELKGIVGSDGRKYILDCLRITPRDANWIPTCKGGTAKWDKVDEGNALKSELKNDYVALLRPELVQRWRRRQQEFKTLPSNKVTLHPGESGVPDEEPLNVNVFMPFDCAADKKVAAEDEERVRTVSKWLWDSVLPALTSEVRRGSIVPLESNVLVEVLHSFGVNVRYMGRLAQLAKEEEESDLLKAKQENECMSCNTVLFPLFWRRMLELEMITRAAKHVFRRLLDKNPDTRLRPSLAISQFLNSLFGNGGDNRDLPSELFSEFEELSRNAGVVADTSSSASTSNTSNSESTVSASALKRMKRKKAAAAKQSSESSQKVLSAKQIAKNDAELQQNLAALVLSPPPSLGNITGPVLWALISQEVRSRFHYELSIWPNPQQSSNAAWKGFSLENQQSKTCLLRRVCQKLGLRIRAKSYDFKSLEPFQIDDILDAVPVPKGSGGGGPPGWSKALFQQSGPLSWLLDMESAEAKKETENSEEKAPEQPKAGDATAAEAAQEKDEAQSEEEENNRSHSLSPLPFGNGTGSGSGGHPALTPCPLSEVDELLAMAHLQSQSRQWGPVYELSQQAFALSQAVCGPLHRSTALALEFIARGLFHLGDPETAVAQQTKALAIHAQLGGFDTPDVASAHTTLATYHHKLGLMEVSPRSPSASLPNLDRRIDRASRHIRSAAYLYELMGGPLHPEIGECFNKLGQYYHEASSIATQHEFPASLLEGDKMVNGGLGAVYAVNALRCYREALRRGSLLERHHLKHASDKGTATEFPIEVKKEGTVWSNVCKCEVPSLGEDVLSLITEETAKLAQQLGGGADGAPVTNSTNLNQPALLNRILQAQSLHTMALLYERPLGLGKEALQLERVAYRVFRLLLGDKHHLSTTSAFYLKRFTEISLAESKAAKAASKQLKSGAPTVKSSSQVASSVAPPLPGSDARVVSEADRLAADNAMKAMIEAETKAAASSSSSGSSKSHGRKSSKKK